MSVIKAIKFREDFDNWRMGDVETLEQTLMRRLIRCGKALEVEPESSRDRSKEVKKKDEPKPEKPRGRKKKTEKAVKV